MTTRDEAIAGIRSALEYLDGIHAVPFGQEVRERTPERWLTFLEDATGGMAEPAITTVRFAVAQSGPVQVTNVTFYSLCEHHLLPFFGTVSLEYVPGDEVVGISSLVQVVERHARRLQLQERLTRDVGTDVALLTGARRVKVQVVAEHLCMSMRGVMKPGSLVTTEFVTSSDMKEDRP